ncbi:Meiosis-specific serine/threonine-protein kinase mek1 [Golovinomyces cichoracearum]|uniref:Meiosis-specific serine/threonine-protein kinase mek1 n=1 Tax=Golovinomyces cichoracearum TaxID=62708 RepID=A0A420IZE7_9PEZI|nr:Meiosis-specific serine/threonine-protein kinase mek1 [Golovinomyces cichoracearum]
MTYLSIMPSDYGHQLGSSVRAMKSVSPILHDGELGPIAFLICYKQQITAQSECHIDNDQVSKLHFRMYSVIYEKDRKSNMQPLVYCEDLESTNGTFVNNNCIGRIGHERIGHLLSDGDLIEIRPHWYFRFNQPAHRLMSFNEKNLADLKAFSGRLLGKGHFGAVFLAKDLATSRQLACKIVDLNEAAYEITETIQSDPLGQRWINKFHKDRDGKRLVMREIRILSKLSHPHIINLKKAFCSDTHLYIFTELAPAGDLFSYIESHGGFLTDLHSRVVSRQLVLAIKYIHSQGIVHRDIKPENVLIMQNDFGSRVVLTDFGFASYINKETGRLSSRLGTEGFIAPEVEFPDLADGGYTMSVDLWSLGILTVCLLTGSILIPKIDISESNQNQIQALFDNMHENQLGNRWQLMSSNAFLFIRRLLVVNPARRISASEALHHPWYTMPATEASMIKTGYQRVIRFWKKRNSNDVLKRISTNKNISTELGSISESKAMIRLPDTTLSPYFNLDRHLEKKRGQRPKNILRDLNGSFFTSEANQKVTQMRTVSSKIKK